MIKLEKKFGAHTHFTPHMFTKCCNITTTVNNASTVKTKNHKLTQEFFIKLFLICDGFVEIVQQTFLNEQYITQLFD